MNRQIQIGKVKIGGGAPVLVQSMTNTKTSDVSATVRQIKDLTAAGCEIVRVAIPDMDAAKSIEEIKKQIDIPLVGDIHFDYKLALVAIQQGIDKIRINPGNIGEESRVREVARACKEKNIPIRIGINAGSLDKMVLEKFGKASAEALVYSALENVRLLNQYDFDDICISIKASEVKKTIEAYRLLAEQTDYPLHLGVTEAGTYNMGVIKSAIGIGALLADGIGDTLRVSLTDSPVREVEVGLSILRALGLRKDTVEIVSCPTCGRCGIDLISLANQVETALSGVKKPLKVAVMGCVVNGPGEAKDADYGICGGDGVGLLFKKGEVVKKADFSQLVNELINLMKEDSAL